MNESQNKLRNPKIKVKRLPRAEKLKECLRYNSRTGILTWKTRPPEHFTSQGVCNMWNGKYAGHVAGRKVRRHRDGKRHAIFVKVGFNGKNQVYLAHRIIFAMLKITVPRGMQIDHKNRNPWNNRRSNLRIATPGQNIINETARKRKHAHLPKGVFKTTSGLQSRIRWKGIEYNLGMFKTPEEAHKAYRKKCKEFHGSFFCPKQMTRVLEDDLQE